MSSYCYAYVRNGEIQHIHKCCLDIERSFFCIKCDEPPSQHVRGKCLYSTTQFTIERVNYGNFTGVDVFEVFVRNLPYED